MSDLLIRSLLETRLITWAESQGFRVAVENVAFTPPAELYLDCFVLPATTTSQALAGDHTAYTGVFQVGIRDVLGGGSAEALRIAAMLRAQFPTNLLLTHGDFTLQIITPLSVASGFPSDGRWLVPCSTRYRSDTN